MIDALPLDLFDDQEPAETASRLRVCQWCGADLAADVEDCAECGGRTAIEAGSPVPGLTELTPEQAAAERRPLRRPEPTHGSDADDPVPLVAALTVVEIAVDVIRSRRAQRRARDAAERNANR